MGQEFDRLDDKLVDWIGRQRMYFVGTAPSGDDGLVNISPKGWMDSFRVLGPTQIAYLDVFGSGVETIAHLKQNGRIVVMLCAFEGGPRILRMHGRGEVLENGTPEFDEVIGAFPPGATQGGERSIRSIIRVDIVRIADSCGYGVPVMDYVGERDTYERGVEVKERKQGAEELLGFRRKRAAASLDGLPGLSQT
ncbi:MAG: pyridoxamine 5'-phosphate oxidase family protein [Solirubrobacteraceae bacterium]|nr:pyridoxamine 5'-phosphate oxidase family protein [Solirubrobacteraceae bacterium]